MSMVRPGYNVSRGAAVEAGVDVALATITASFSEKILRLYMLRGLGHHYGFVVFAYDVDFEFLLKG